MSMYLWYLWVTGWTIYILLLKSYEAVFTVPRNIFYISSLLKHLFQANTDVRFPLKTLTFVIKTCCNDLYVLYLYNML